MPVQPVVLASRRTVLLTSLARYEKFLEDFDPERDQVQVEARLTRFEILSHDLEGVQQELEDSATTPEEVAQNATLRENFEDRLIIVQSQLQAKVRMQQASNAQSSTGTNPLKGIKLPTIALPEFTGDYMQWLTFRDTFECLIHKNVDLPAIQKFHYLRAAVKGEAAQVIESITISAANYDLAWNTLTERYSNEYLLKKRHLQAMFAIPAAQKESVATLHHLVDEFERHKKILQHLGEETNTWGSILEHLLCTKLPVITLRDWEEHASNSNDPSYDSLVTFLHRRMRVLETLLVNSTHASGTQELSYPRRMNFPRQASFASTAYEATNCLLCNAAHNLLRCQQFEQMRPKERHRFAMTANLCLNCLRENHMARDCPSNYRCRHCNAAHHTKLHFTNTGTTSTAPHSTNFAAHNTQTSTAPQNTNFTAQNSTNFTAPPHHTHVTTSDHTATSTQPTFAAALQHAPEQVLLQTALITIVDEFGISHPARALLDSASQPNLISDRLAHRLRLKKSNVNITIVGAGQATKTVRESVNAQIRSRCSSFVVNAEFLIVDNLIANLPTRDIEVTDWKIPPGFVLADPAFNRAAPVDIILGARHYHTFFDNAAHFRPAPHLPVMMDSVFGWVMTGAATIEGHAPKTPSTPSYTTVCMASLEESLQRFWQLENLSVNDAYSPDERYCETFYKSTTERDDTGRYMVRLPKQPDFDERLGLSRPQALRRFELLERRLERDPALREAYQTFMKEYLDLGHMSPISTECADKPVYYLPHHPVFKASSTTTKVRVVFDGSAKTSTGFSLNETLRFGPIVQDELIDIILRFRTYKVAVVGDIAKMYRQITLHPDDRRLVRIFFRFSSQSPITVYELNTVTYGLAPSSFLATRTLLQLAEDEGAEYPHAAHALKRNFYVDDFIGGANSVDEARKLRQQLSGLLAKGGFELRKWTSNCLDVLTGLPAEDIGTQSSLQFSPNETVKALGIAWKPELDVLCFQSPETMEATNLTMRSILSNIARMFDPLGLIAPVIIRAKLLMQELWLQKIGWDDPVPPQICNKWRTICNDWQDLADFKCERYVLLPNSTIQFHTFADASEVAYGACVYARCEDQQGQVRVTLLASKSRVAPLKRVTLPRLELCAAVLGAHLHHRVRRAMDIDATESFFWSDSTVTLNWIASPPNTWKTFVANRVAEIQCHSHPRQWKHVPGSSNPADLVSRGISAAEMLKGSLWSCGPDWLALPSSGWPDSNFSLPADADMETRQVSAVVANIQTTHPWFNLSSSYTKLLHVFAYSLRFVHNTKHKTRTQPSPQPTLTTISITPKFMEAAKIALCKLAQQDGFSTEIQLLKKGEVVGKHSPLRRLNPFLDEEGLLRVGGRLKLSQLPYQFKHPIVLPKNHPLANLVAVHCHEKLMHGGGRLLLSQIREEYWPLDGRRLVKKVVRNCFRCIRQDPSLTQQQTGQLPCERITPSRPFSITGVDYAGPFYLKPAHKRAAPAKCYLCVFVCFSTKAVHLELVSDLTTAGFLAALHRFTSRRGLPSDIYSDNGKNFEGAAHELKELFDMFQSEQQQNIIASNCSDKGITWHFTPPKAPHFGGLWEAAVKTAKRHLYRQLGSSRLSYEGYSTILQQIEAAMNSRPLLPMTDDPNDLAALTPAHFLIGTSMHAVPVPDYTRLKAYTLDDWQSWQLLVQRFWKHWTSEYLQEMQKDNKVVNRCDILPGRLVILMDESLPITRWPLARIVDVHPGEDQLTRVVKLKTAKGIITRPVTKICLLPFAKPSA